MKKILMYIAVFTAGLAFTSCNSGDQKEESEKDSLTHTTPIDTSMVNRDSVMANADTAAKSRDSARLHMGVQKP